MLEFSVTLIPPTGCRDARSIGTASITNRDGKYECCFYRRGFGSHMGGVFTEWVDDHDRLNDCLWELVYKALKRKFDK